MLRFGLFGAGRIGRVHAASLAAHPQTELAVVHDPVEAAALEVAAQYGGRPTQDAAAHVRDYARFTTLLKWSALTVLVIAFVVLLILAKK